MTCRNCGRAPALDGSDYCEPCELLLVDTETLYEGGWMRTPDYGPRPGMWWREAGEDDSSEVVERCLFGGPAAVWAETAERAMEIDDLREWL